MSTYAFNRQRNSSSSSSFVHVYRSSIGTVREEWWLIAGPPAAFSRASTAVFLRHGAYPWVWFVSNWSPPANYQVPGILIVPFGTTAEYVLPARSFQRHISSCSMVFSLPTTPDTQLNLSSHPWRIYVALRQGLLGRPRERWSMHSPINSSDERTRFLFVANDR